MMRRGGANLGPGGAMLVAWKWRVLQILMNTDDRLNLTAIKMISIA